ncbi:hypothetical protein QAD02_022146 [Eretmocerus hayati]|uniref:Uncharacterized protein n=2 Tax=Eretmocerus hayati TaxID=131215 RepID=A0ACC2PVG3_9HYME|nr:hypothetical protein QAD02_008351 [Eretmocerus hayati]KAJ8686352.1 hypothetical protein QAD02_022146 [Eretmocerus hayati]
MPRTLINLSSISPHSSDRRESSKDKNKSPDNPVDAIVSINAPQPIDDPLTLKNCYVVEYKSRPDEEQEEETLLSVANIKWIDLELEEVYLPPKNLLRKRSLYKYPPDVDEQKWTLHKCEQLVGPLDYYEALKKAKEMSGTEGEKESDEEVDTNGKGNRRKKAPLRFSPPPNSKKNRSYVSKNDKSDSSSSEESGESSGSSSSSDSSDSEENEMGRENDSSEDENRTVKNNPKRKRSKEPPTSVSNKKHKKRDSTIAHAAETRVVNGALKALHVEVQDVSAKLDDFVRKKQKKKRTKRREQLPKLPMETGAEVIKMEKLLKKKRIRLAFEERLDDIGGDDSTSFVRNIFRGILSPKMVEKFSWSGVNTKKCRFMDSAICKSIVAVVSESYGTENEVRKKIRIKLQHAKGDNKRLEDKPDTLSLMEALLLDE